tara:strand:+ start:2300 stop:4396 length:2097 start_codon:yes stop_codon:yes gene_type:complete
MTDFTPVDKPTKLKNDNNSNTSDTSNFSAVDKPSKLKFDEIVDVATDTVGDAGRLVNTGISSAIATVPSLPESLLNLASLGFNYGGKKLGLIPENKSAKYIDIPFLPSFDEAQTAIAAPKGQINYLEGLLSEGKKEEIVSGLLDMKLIPNTPAYNRAYLTQLEIASGKKPSLEMQTGIGEFLKTPVEYFGMGRVFGKTSGRISGFAGTVDSSLKLAGVNDKTAMIAGLGTDVVLSIIAGVKNPAYISRLKTTVQDSIKNGKLDEAKDLLKFANEYDIPLYGIEALAQTTKDNDLIALAKITAMTDEGSKYFKGINGRELKLNDKANKFITDFFGTENIRYLDVSQKMVDALNKRVVILKQKINKAARRSGYKKFDEFSFGNEVTNEVANTLAEMATSPNLTKSKSQQFLKYSKEIKGGNQKALQSLSQDLSSDIAVAKKAGDNKLVGYLTEIKGVVDTSLNQIEGYARGAATYKNLKNKILNPIEEAVTANNTIRLNREATMGLLESVLLGKQDNITVSRLFKELNKIDKTLAPEVAASLFTEIFSKIKISPSMGKNMFNAVYGNPKQKRQVQAILTGVAKAQKKDPVMVIKGFERMLETFNATSKFTGGESITFKSGEFASDMGMPKIKLNPLDTFDKIVANGNWNDFAKIITSPNSLDTLVALSKTPVRANWPVLIQPIFQGYRQVESKPYEETTQ